MITSLTIRTTIWSVHRKIATKHLIRYQMHFAFVYFVNNRYDKRIPLIKWLIVISKRIVSSRSFSVSMFFSQSPSLHFSLSLSLSSLSKPFESRSLHKWYTIIDHKYFIFRGIVYCSNSCLTVVCLRCLRRRKTTVSMNITILP